MSHSQCPDRQVLLYVSRQYPNRCISSQIDVPLSVSKQMSHHLCPDNHTMSIISITTPFALCPFTVNYYTHHRIISRHYILLALPLDSTIQVISSVQYIPSAVWSYSFCVSHYPCRQCLKSPLPVCLISRLLFFFDGTPWQLDLWQSEYRSGDINRSLTIKDTSVYNSTCNATKMQQLQFYSER